MAQDNRSRQPEQAQKTYRADIFVRAGLDGNKEVKDSMMLE